MNLLKLFLVSLTDRLAYLKMQMKVGIVLLATKHSIIITEHNYSKPDTCTIYMGFTVS